MILSYKYKLRPNNQQFKKLSVWLDMLRANYNWCLRDRVDGWHQQFICGSYSDLRTQVEITPLTCSLVKGTQLANPWKDGGGKAKKEGKKDRYPKRTVVLMQDANLQELKDARPWYQEIDVGVLQLIVARVNESFNKFFKGAGFPKFKRHHDFKSFSYKPGRIKICVFITHALFQMDLKSRRSQLDRRLMAGTFRFGLKTRQSQITQ